MSSRPSRNIKPRINYADFDTFDNTNDYIMEDTTTTKIKRSSRANSSTNNSKSVRYKEYDENEITDEGGVVEDEVIAVPTRSSKTTRKSRVSNSSKASSTNSTRASSRTKKKRILLDEEDEGDEDDEYNNNEDVDDNAVIDGDEYNDNEEDENNFNDDVENVDAYTKKTSTTAHQLKYTECEEAYEESEKYLTHYVSVFQPFITIKVYDKLKSLYDMIVKNKKLRAVYHHDVIESIGQPSTIVNCTLRDYQLEGISWMVDRYDKAINVILADEMGLGKTLQTISFIAHLIHVRGLKGPHLVVVPLSVLFNWVQELKKWCPLLKFVRLHANDSTEQERLKLVIKDANQTEVVLTTYETIKSAKMSGPLRRIIWRSVILDEGHKLKNEDSAIHNAARMLKTRFRLILTGTPVQNNLHETYALLSYLAPHLFKDSATFDSAFNLNESGKQNIVVDRDMLSKAHYMLRPFILRRLKVEVEKALPPKLETKILCPMSEMQKFWIRSLLLKEKDALQRVAGGTSTSGSGGGLTEWKKLNSLMAQLRKAANHPYLFEGAEPPSLDGRAGGDIITASGKMVVLDKLLTKLKERGHRVVLFSQYTRTLDIISDYLVFRGYDATCRLDGQTNRVMREVYINMFNKKDSKKFIFLLSTRAGGEGVNLFTADTVILFDSDWNPQVDIQAMARVHRIGQTKPVHVYRLVSSGSVEERIVQRAQKKLFLDSMVNRGSTANAKLLDEQLDNNNNKTEGVEGGGGDEEKEDVEPSKILSALKFGWNSIFSVDKVSQEISDADLETILDRTRGLGSSTELLPTTTAATAEGECGEGATEGTTGGAVGAPSSFGLMEGIQSTVDDFDETIPLVPIRELDGEEVPKAESTSTLKAISEGWRQYMLPEGAKRRRKARTYEVNVEGVGVVQVLNSDNYSLAQGEPSVFEKEIKTKSLPLPKGVQTFVPTTGRQVAGRDYGHQDFCQECWDGKTDENDLVNCDVCPAAFHMDCLGPSPGPSGIIWQCPHHVCCRCQRKSSAAGLLFRCEVCPSAYCEDCLPSDHSVTGDSERLNRLGFRLPSSACYILCRQQCIDFYFHLGKTEGGDIIPRHRDDATLSKKMQNASRLGMSKKRSKSDSGGGGEGGEGGEEGGGDPNNNVHEPVPDSVDPVKALGMCQLGDIKIRLLRNNNARFINLKELNGFAYRWAATSVHTKTIFAILVNSLLSQFDHEEESGATAEGEEEEDHILAYKGAPASASNEAIYKAFLNTIRRLTEIHKGKIVDIGRLIGLSVVTVLKKASALKDVNLPPSSIEPKFKQIDDQLPRRCLEEALAAFLVLPHPQNLILAPPVSEDKSCANCPDLPLPLGSTMYVARIVEALGDKIIDQNKKFFTALSVRDGDFGTIVHGWNEVYINKEPYILSELRQLLLPVKRLHALQKDVIPHSVRALIDENCHFTLKPGGKRKYEITEEDDGKKDDDSDYENSPLKKEGMPKERKKKGSSKKDGTFGGLSASSMVGIPGGGSVGGGGGAVVGGVPIQDFMQQNFPLSLLHPSSATSASSAAAAVGAASLHMPLPPPRSSVYTPPVVGCVIQLEDFSKVSHLLHEWVSPIKQVPSSSSGFIIQVSNFTMYDWSIGRVGAEMIRSNFTPYEGLHSRMRYPKFALQLQPLVASGQALLVPIDEHVELIFILMFKFFAIDFRIKNVVDLALDKAQEEGYLAPNESILSPAVVFIMRNTDCFRKLFGVVIEKMKLNIKNRIQNLGEGPTVWLQGETITQLRETILAEGTDGLLSSSLREAQYSSYKSAGPGVNFRCSQTVIEAISCSVGQYSLKHETTRGFSSDYVRQTTPNQEAIVLALLKWYFLFGACETPEGKSWDDWVGEEARTYQPFIETDRLLLEKNRELIAFLSGCRKRYFSVNPLICNNEYMT